MFQALYGTDTYQEKPCSSW